VSTPEAKARSQIDRQLEASGWTVQDVAQLNLAASQGIAVREIRSQGGPADYILFVDGRALGVVNAKNAGTTLSSIAEQSTRYSHARKRLLDEFDDFLITGMRGSAKTLPEGTPQVVPKGQDNFTATPSKATLGFFSRNLITEKHRRLVGVLDGVSAASATRSVSRREEPANQCPLLLRNVRSQLYFEQMKGRGTPAIDPAHRQAA